MKKVLVIGSSGMLGSALVKNFSNGYSVTAWDRGELDVTNESMVGVQCAALAPDIIINATAHNGVDIVETDDHAFKQAHAINTQAVGILALWCKKAGIPLVHFSTDYVFDGTSSTGYTETAEPQPVNRYGQTKFAGEQVLQKRTDAFYLVRLSRLFGRPGPSATSKKSFVDILISQVLNEGRGEIKLINEEYSCPTYSTDVAAFVRALIDGAKPYGIYHAANTGVCTWFELGKELFKLKNFTAKLTPISSSDYHRSAKRPARSELVNTKMPRLRSWQKALADYVAGEGTK